MKFVIDFPSTTCIMFQGIDQHIADSAFTLKSHRTIWQQQYDPSGQYGRRRKTLRFSFLSIRRHPCGNKTTRANVPEGAKIDVLTQESCAFVVPSRSTGVLGSVKREFAVIVSFDCSALSVRQLIHVLGLWERAGYIQVSKLKATLAISPSRCRVPSSTRCWHSMLGSALTTHLRAEMARPSRLQALLPKKLDANGEGARNELVGGTIQCKSSDIVLSRIRGSSCHGSFIS